MSSGSDSSGRRGISRKGSLLGLPGRAPVGVADRWEVRSPTTTSGSAPGGLVRCGRARARTVLVRTSDCVISRAKCSRWLELSCSECFIASPRPAEAGRAGAFRPPHTPCQSGWIDSLATPPRVTPQSLRSPRGLHAAQRSERRSPRAPGRSRARFRRASGASRILGAVRRAVRRGGSRHAGRWISDQLHHSAQKARGHRPAGARADRERRRGRRRALEEPAARREAGVGSRCGAFTARVDASTGGGRATSRAGRHFHRSGSEPIGRSAERPSSFRGSRAACPR